MPVKIAILGFLVPMLLATGSVRASELSTARAQLYQDYASQLLPLVEWCQAEGLVEQAEQVRHWVPIREPNCDLFFVLDDSTVAPALPSDASPSLRTWYERFSKLRSAQAEALFALVRRAAEAGQTSLALTLLVETVRENPDHHLARTLLGYQQVEGQWLTPYAKRLVDAGQVWHPRFGWLPGDYVEKYEAGQRRLGSLWLTADEDAERRQEFARGWQIKTEHYAITTNHSLEAGVQLAARLEHFYQVWRQAFAGYWLSPADLKQALASGKAIRQPTRQHQVSYYRTREEYNQALRPQQPNIEMTIGIYFPKQRRANFFAGADQDPGTIYHEATHQLFQETARGRREAGEQNNFWIVEGVACYCESLTQHGDYFTLGGLEAGRMPAARQALAEGDYIPFAELTPLGIQALQRHPRLARLYSQAAGQTTFLLHADSARYREPTLRYLSEIYRSKADRSTLAKLTKVRYELLDREYRQYLTAPGLPAAQSE